MKLKYQVQTPNAAGSLSTVAKFAKRSNAIGYALDFDNVTVKRVTDYTNRVVFSRKTSKANGFVTVSETETLRDRS